MSVSIARSANPAWYLVGVMVVAGRAFGKRSDVWLTGLDYGLPGLGR